MVNLDDIHPGMAVYGDDGPRIGTVKEVFPDGQIPDFSRPNNSVEGGVGTLGDESRVYTDTDAGGGPGTLGDDERVYTDTGAGGGPETLGDESSVGGRGSGMTASAEPEGYIVSEEVVVVEEGEAAETGGEPVFEVDHGGFLGFGTKRLFVPLSAVARIVPDTSVMLACRAQECMERYTT